MKKLIFAIFYTLLILSFYACGNAKSESLDMEFRDTVAMTTISICDSLSVELNEDKKCIMRVDAQITYPRLFVDRSKTDELQRLFSNGVLHVDSDTLSLASAFPVYLSQLMMDVIDSEYDENRIGDNLASSECTINVNIIPIYNDGIHLSYCKECILSFLGEKSCIKEFIVFGLDEMKELEFSDIYDIHAIGIVKTMLKDKLHNIYNVKNDDELSELGFYKIYDIEVNDNFYFTNDSVVWNYSQHDLSIFGDVSVALSRSDIERKIENMK